MCHHHQPGHSPQKMAGISCSVKLKGGPDGKVSLLMSESEGIIDRVCFSPVDSSEMRIEIRISAITNLQAGRTFPSFLLCLIMPSRIDG
jgi:hypothetical protein